MSNDVSLTGTLRLMGSRFERQLIEAALGGAQGNVTQAALALGEDRANLHRRIRRLGIRIPNREATVVE